MKTSRLLTCSSSVYTFLDGKLIKWAFIGLLTQGRDPGGIRKLKGQQRLLLPGTRRALHCGRIRGKRVGLGSERYAMAYFARDYSISPLESIQCWLSLINGRRGAQD